MKSISLILRQFLFLFSLIAFIPLVVQASDSQLVSNYVTIKEISREGSKGVYELTFDYAGLPEKPNQAEYHDFVAGVPGQAISMEIEEIEWFVYPVTDSDWEIEGPFGLDDTESWSYAADRIRQSAAGIFRHVSIHQAEFPLIRNTFKNTDSGRMRGTAVTKRMIFTIDTGEPPENPVSDDYLVSLMQGEVINSSQLHELANAAEPMENYQELLEWNEMLREAEELGPLLKAKLPRGGVYRLTMESFQEAGVEPESLPADRIRVFAGADELPLWEVSISNNRVIGDASMMFYVPEFIKEKKPYTALWVFLAPEGTEALRMERPFSYSGDMAKEPLLVDHHELFEPGEYNHMLPDSERFGKWSTFQLGSVGHKDYEFLLKNPDPTRTSSIDFWLAATQSRDSADWIAYINSEEIGRGSVRGRRVYEQNLEIPPGILKDGTNVFSVRNDGNAGAGGNSLAFIGADLHATLLPHGMPINRTVSIVRSEGQPFQLAGPLIGDTEDPRFFIHVTNPLSPQLFTPRLITEGEERLYRTTVNVEAREPAFIFSSLLTMRQPQLEKVSAPGSFLDREGVDYLAIYYDSLGDSLQKLLNVRSATRRTASYPVSDIYNAFSYGEISYVAIHDALRHLFRHREGTPLSEVLLVGEGSDYWWEYRQHSPNVSKNMLPIYGWANSQIKIHGDDDYGQLTGQDDLTDLEIGRFSVNTPEELDGVINKVLAYEQSPPNGEWMNRHLFVMDDEPEFLRVGQEILEKAFTGANVPKLMPLQNYPYEDYFRGRWRKRSVVITDRLIEQWNRGWSTITYLGHGGPNLWSGERILHIRDIDRTDPEGRLPLLIAGSCDTGWVDYPIDPVRTSLAETMLRDPEGGVAGAFIPIAGTSSYEHNFLLTEFYRGLFKHDASDAGEATLLSKLNYFRYRNNSSVTRQFLLMGDPGLPLAKGKGELTLNAAPQKLLTATGGKLLLQGQTSVGWGMAEASLFTPEWELAARQRFRVNNGQFSGEMQIPGYLKAGRHRLIVSAQNEFEGTFQSASAIIDVETPDLTVRWSSNPPIEAPLPVGTPIEMTYEITNNSSIPLENAVLEIWDDERGRRLDIHAVKVGAGEKISRSFQNAAPAGVNAFRGDLYLKLRENDEPARRLASGRLVLRGYQPNADPMQSALAGFSLGEIVIQKAQNRADSVLSLPLYRMADIEYKDLEAVIHIGKQTGNTLGEPVSLAPLDSELSQVFQFRGELDTVEGEQPFVMQVNRDDGETSQVLQLIPFVYDFSNGPDLEIVDSEMVLEETKPKGGKTVFVRFKVRNVGAQTAENVRTELYLNRAWDDEYVAPSSVPWSSNKEIDLLEPGEEREMRLRWDHQGSGGGSYKLYAAVWIEGAAIEPTLSNNIASRDVNLRGAPNLKLLTDQIRVGKDFLQPYDKLPISIPFQNVSGEDFVRDFRISVYAISLDGERRKLVRRDFDRLNAGDAGALQFDWEVQPREYQLFINLNEDREYLESTFDDNEENLEFTYVFPAKLFLEPESLWDFRSFMQYGVFTGAEEFPGGRYQTVEQPQAIVEKFGFTRENLLQGEVGERARVDNLIGIDDKQNLFMMPDENPDSVTFRFPLETSAWADHYDLYVHNIGKRSNQITGYFRYRINDSDWMEVPSPEGMLHLGRFNIRGDDLRFAIGPVDYPAFNHIFSFSAYPVAGEYISPVFKGEQLPSGSMIVDAKIPEGARVDVLVRHGRDGGDQIAWGEWAATADGLAPQPEPESQFFQWKARLISSPEEPPSLFGVAFETTPGSHSQETELTAAGN